jgi:hypothetical protein
MRLEGREATHPLRPGRRRMAPDRRSGEVAFGVALPVRLIPVDPEQAAPAKVPLDAPDQALEHLAHLTGPEVREPLPGELAAILVPGPVQDDEVEVRVQPQLVVGDEARIEVRLRAGCDVEVYVALDGQEAFAFADGDHVVVTGSPRRLMLVKAPGRDYYAVLRTKLKWGEAGAPPRRA